MALIKLTYRNILESGTVTFTDENSSFPAYRLYDRDIGKLFKFNSHGANLYIEIDQGASPIYPVDRCIIPPGHTLNSMAMKIQYSTTGAWGGEEVDAASWTQADALIINKSFTQQTKQYWRLLITSDPAAPPELPELFIGADYTFERNPTFGSRDSKKRNILRDETRSGRVRTVKFGEIRKFKVYDLNLITATQKTNLETFLSVIDSNKYFWVTDEEGTIFFAELMNDLDFIFKSYNSDDIYSVSLELLEVL